MTIICTIIKMFASNSKLIQQSTKSIGYLHRGNKMVKSSSSSSSSLVDYLGLLLPTSCRLYSSRIVTAFVNLFRNNKEGAGINAVSCPHQSPSFAEECSLPLSCRVPLATLNCVAIGSKQAKTRMPRKKLLPQTRRKRAAGIRRRHRRPR